MNMAAFGKELGVSRETVRKWSKAGMPGDRDGAVAWLAENRPKYVEKLVGDVVADGAGSQPSGGSGDLMGMDIYSTLERFREIELRAWVDLDRALEARKGAPAGSQSAVKLDAEISRLDKRYKQSATDVMDMEKRVADFDLETGRRVSMERVKELINDNFAGLKVQIEAMPAMECRNLNPEDPETAEREATRWVRNLFKHLRGEND